MWALTFPALARDSFSAPSSLVWGPWTAAAGERHYLSSEQVALALPQVCRLPKMSLSQAPFQLGFVTLSILEIASHTVQGMEQLLINIFEALPAVSDLLWFSLVFSVFPISSFRLC